MISHEGARWLAAEAIDRDLDVEDAEALATHLGACAPCRAVDEGLRADALALASLELLDPPGELRQRVLDAAETPGSIPPLPALADPPSRPGTILRFPDRLPARLRQPALLVAAAAVIVAVVGGTLAWRSSVSGPGDVAVIDPSNPPAGSSAAPIDGASGPPGSVRPDGPLVPTTWEAVAELAAEDMAGGVVRLGTSFRLASVTDTPAAVLAQRLRVQPPLALSVTDEPDGAVRLTPDEPLTPGAVYRFTLEGDGGETLDTWAFQAQQPLRVVATVPEDTQTEVPLDSGIEITFDQDGVVDPEAHVSIEPATKGRFEQHDRVLVFVPDGLEPATVYTVTVHRGVAIEGTDEILEADVRFQFETAAVRDGGDPPAATLRFATDLFESGTAERPTVSLWSFGDANVDGGGEEPSEARLDVYRLADQNAAIGAFRQIRGFPRWSRWNATDRVPTEGLQRVVRVDARLQAFRGTLWARLPERLPAGWYLVEQPSGDRASQAILQVTDIAGYLVVSDTQTLVWANDLSSGDPVSDASVAADGTEMGRTGEDGTLLAATPASLLPATDEPCTDGCEPIVTVRAGDRSAFLPATGPRDADGRDGGLDSSFFFDTGDTKFWRLFHTDRTLYRRSDTINIWGALRDRDTGRVPQTVTVRLAYADGDSPQPPIATLRATPRSTGAFTGSMALEDVPEGSYVLELVVGERTVARQTIRVDRILKPAYRLEVLTGRRVYIAGDRIRVTATASFYEGTPVPGVPLRLSGLVEETPMTDAAGTAIVRTIAKVDEDHDTGGPDFQDVSVTPARPEEGEIAGASREFVVYPSSWTITATSEVRAGRVRLAGGVHMVDVDRLEAEVTEGRPIWELDPRGDPVRNRVVTATFTEIIPVRRQVGTEYDFIEKKTKPVYEYDYDERAAGTLRLRTDDLGAFSGSVAATDRGHDYRIDLRLTDPDGHIARARSDASAALQDRQDERFAGVTLTPTEGPEDEQLRYGIGDRIDLTMRDPDATAGADDDPHLFFESQRGLRSATVQASPRYTSTFAEWAAPNLRIDAVRFTGRGYVAAQGYDASFRVSDRALSVELTPDAERYAPGETVSLNVTTRAADGDPVAATVVLRAIDEKLYSIGGAEAVDPLAELYDFVPDGLRATYGSHRAPQGRPEGGDTTGGGGREDLRDSVLFQAVDTGADGRASVTFKVADDLTSWRVSGSAVGAGLEAGEGTVAIAVGLPFFVDTSLAPEYLVDDRPVIQVRAFGTSLTTDDQVTFAVTSDTLGLDLDGLRAKAFESVAVPLPALSLGGHRITISATTGDGSGSRTDRLTRSFTVVASRLAQTRVTHGQLVATASLEGGEGLTRVVVADATAGQHLPLLLDLASVGSARMERALAALLAGSLIEERFGGMGDAPAETSFDGPRYQTEDGGIALVPHASSDLEASVLAAIVAPTRFDGVSLRSYLRTVADAATETRERRNFALAGLAGLRAPVLHEIAAAAADPELTVRERLFLGLGAAAAGDAPTARAIAAALIEEFGEASGDQARLRAGTDNADSSAATALMAMLAAANGDPLAARFWGYVVANPSQEATFALHAIGYVERTLEHLPAEAARFAYTIDGTRTDVELAPGESFALTVSAAQLAALGLEPVGGRLAVTTTWREAVDPADLETDRDLTIRRSVTPSGRIGAGDLVVVDLLVIFGEQAPQGCHRVTDLLPSGLVAVGVLDGWTDPETGAPPTGVTYPIEQTGQRVVFCAEPGPTAKSRLRYVARVITTGTYRWEPAVVESRTVPGRAAIVPIVEVEIR